jgi:hypothetical protein
MPLVRDIEKLNPIVKEKFKLALAELDKEKIFYYINETYRSQLVQDAYYAQGRQPLDVVNTFRAKAGLVKIGLDESKNIITNAKVSKHTSGKAVDIYLKNGSGGIVWSANRFQLEPMATIIKSFGFEWGGDWTKPDINGKVFTDLPHYEYNGVI